MAVERIAQGRYRQMVKLAARTSARIRELWMQVDPARLDLSWAVGSTNALTFLTAGQAAAAAEADPYITAALTAQQIDPAAAGAVVARTFAGVASDGRNLLDLLGEAPIVAKSTIARGGSVERAMSAGAVWLDMMVRTQVADAGRTAEGVAIAARRAVGGYVRMLVPPSCSRCTILAGKWYRWNAGFQRHPRCFPAGVVVAGPRSQAATRRLYQGELVVLATASGQQLALTGNHPVLTGGGWVPAHLLQEGDEVVRSTRAEGATALVVPDEHQMPSRIEDVWGSLGVPLLDAVESSPEDFHGDGQHGQVDVVWADGTLDDRLLPALTQHGREGNFARAAGAALTFHGQGAPELLDLAEAPHPGRPVGLDDLRLALLRRLPSRAGEAGLAHPSALDSSVGEDSGDRTARSAVLLGKAVFAGAAEVGLDDRLGGQGEPSTRWDAPGGPLTVQTRDGYAARGRDLLQRLAGQVELDRLIEVRRVEWSGHVYSLTSAEGWHSANSLIVSNCDCRHIPTAEDHAGSLVTSPRRYFDSLSAAEQDQAFTRAGAQAIRDGADISQVVNARRGMTSAGTTTASTTRRGVAERGRLMPEAIYRQAGNNRDEAIRLLKQHGYLA